MPSYIIGVTGGSASGKSHFLDKLLSNFSEQEVCYISQDHYYYPREDQPIDDQGIKNFDTPESINFKQFVADIEAVRSGQVVIVEEYTYNNPQAVPKTIHFNPAPVILIEGIFVFYHQPVADLLDLKIFIDADEHIKLSRRILRDRIERGYDVEDVLYRYEKHVAPTYVKYIEPFKQHADLVIPNNQQFDEALDILSTFLKAKIACNQG